MDFEEAADALYAAPAADFIATRNELAKQLKADGDQLGSTRLKAMRKPTVAAWVANLVARSCRTSSTTCSRSATSSARRPPISTVSGSGS